MSTTFAELNDRVYLELEVAAEFCDVDKIHNAVVQHHAVVTQQSSASSVNVLLGVSAQFTPTELTHDITSLIGKGMPAFIEYQSEDESWHLIRVIGLAQIADYAQLGQMAAAFYTEHAESTTVEPIQYVQFTFIPSGPVRIRFDRDVVRTGLVGNIDLPDHTAELLIKRAQNTMIPRMKLAIDMRGRQDPEIRAMARDIKQSLSEIAAQNMLDIKPLDALWRVWAFRDRGTEDSFQKPTPSARGMYG